MKKPDKKFFVLTSLFALAIPAVVALAAATPRLFYVSGGSMEPTLQVASRISIRKNPYQNIEQIQRGSIIVYSRVEKPSGQHIEVVRRVIGLPGDKVRLSGTRIWVNGQQLPHTLLRSGGKVSVYRETNGNASYEVQYGDNTVPATTYSATVAPNHLLCLGDNRDNATDSRHTGLVSFASVEGKLLP